MRILIVDDHAGIRAALRRLLTAEGWEVCGEAADGASGIEAARQLAPDLVVVDLFMPDMTGIDAARQMRETHPAMAIMLLTSLDPSIQAAAREAGVRATVSKLEGDKVVEGIRALQRGEEFHQRAEE